MNPEIESLFPEKGEVIGTENPRRNFSEVYFLILLFLLLCKRSPLLCKNKQIDKITKLFVTATFIFYIPHANCEKPNTEILTNLNAAHHQLYAKTATSLKVAHYDCSLMDSNKMYSPNKVAACKIEPQNVEISKVKAQIFNRFFRRKLEATMCRASHQRIRWYCGVFDASGIDAKRSTITTDVDLTPEQCSQARLTNKLSINGKEFPIELNVRTTYIKNSGPHIGENPNECDDSGWIIHDTFETYMQDTTLNVPLRGGSVNNWQNIPLPCTLSEGGCQITSTDPHAYCWEKQDNCLFAVREKFEGKMIKEEIIIISLKNQRKNKAFYFKCIISLNHFAIAII